MDRRLPRIAVAVLVWNLLVIGWGAYVRASGSGAGCGAHWPLCDGEVVPRAPSTERLIEWTHRATSGLALVAGLVLAVAAFRMRPAGHRARFWAAASLGLLLVEAGLGAGLVLFELVAANASAARALAMMLHLVNTFLLLGALTMTWHHAGIATTETSEGGSRDPALRRLWVPSLVLLVLSGASGAVAALGDTLFPARSLTEALFQDLSATSMLLRLRVLHPAFAVVAVVAVLVLAVRVLTRSEDPKALRRARAAGLLALVQLAVGTVNLGLLAPIPLQLVHLLLADLLWISTILAGVAAGEGPPTEKGTMEG